MAYSTGQSITPSADKKFLDLVITDLISLSYECKRKYPPVKEVCSVICYCNKYYIVSVHHLWKLSLL